MKISPLLIAWLTDDRDEQYAELSTRGLTNNWSIENYDISLLMVGFTGIWITKLLEDRSNPECIFLGWTFFIAAETYQARS